MVSGHILPSLVKIWVCVGLGSTPREGWIGTTFDPRRVDGARAFPPQVPTSHRPT